MSACSERSSSPISDHTDNVSQWALPDKLNEISGLALTPDQRLFAVTDELAVIHEIDYDNGRLVKAFALGDPTVRADFEGIAVLDGIFWLVTSDGDLYSAEEGANGDRQEFKRYRTGLSKECELEGLSAVPTRHALAMVCKNAKKERPLRVFEWGTVELTISESDSWLLPVESMADAIGRDRVNPSGIAIHPQSGHWFILASRQYALFEHASNGEFIGVIMRLDPNRHRQAEGIAIVSDGRILIADEGEKEKARLTVYNATTGPKQN